MNSYLIDINVWLALSWGLHPFSDRAHGWLGSLHRPQTRLLFCRITQLGLLRLLTNAQVMGDGVLTIGQAFATFDRWREDPRVEFTPEPRGLDPAFRHMAAEFPHKPATKALMDVFLAAFADAGEATLVTFDRALAGIARRRRVSHTLLSAHP